MTNTTQKRKLSVLNVNSIEEEIMLIKESEAEYNENGWIDAREAYKKWLEYINNLK